MKPIYVAEYDGFTRKGTSKYVHAIHVGGERWFIEFYAAACCIYLGPIAFQIGFEWVDDA